MVLNLSLGFRYDIFTRAAFVILKEGGSSVTAKTCKFCAGMHLCQRPAVVVLGLDPDCIDSSNVSSSRSTYCAVVGQLETS